MLHILLDALRSAVLVSGLVVVMMMLIESLNIGSHGRLLTRLKSSRPAQIVLSGLLGLTPGCVGGFASVSLYTHGIISFGALVTMMIASSGDEAFVMLATFPDKAWWIFLIVFAIAIVVGFVTDSIYKPSGHQTLCSGEFEIHKEDPDRHRHQHKEKGKRSFSWKRVFMFLVVSAFIIALLSGWLECGEHEHCSHDSLNLLSEEWMYWLFGALSLIVLVVLIVGSDHFVEEHLWQHIIRKHLASIFLWTLGVLVLVSTALQYLDIEAWINSNTALMIILATLVGIIPESGPHLVFVTLYASGIVPLPVLLASCISQDGHASLPLFAESKRDFLKAKAINCAVALLAGFTAMAFM